VQQNLIQEQTASLTASSTPLISILLSKSIQWFAQACAPKA
jgi:hypothetical protein